MDLLIYRGVWLCGSVGATHSTFDNTLFSNWEVPFLFNLWSLPLSLGYWKLGNDIKREWKPAFSHEVFLTFVFREDDFQTTKWLACELVARTDSQVFRIA